MGLKMEGLNMIGKLSKFQKNALGVAIFWLVPFVIVMVAHQPITMLIVAGGALPGAWCFACAVHEKLTQRRAESPGS